MRQKTDLFSQIVESIKAIKNVEKKTKFQIFLRNAKKIGEIIQELQEKDGIEVSKDSDLIYDAIKKRCNVKLAEAFAAVMNYWWKKKAGRNDLNKGGRQPSGGKPRV